MKFRLKRIKSIKRCHYKGKVYDLTVKDCHSYNINKICVHNSLCETRIRTGVGIPQITAIQECYRAAKKYNIPIIGDGGIRTSGDVCKAIAAGAETVMLGSLLAGTKETPGEFQSKGSFPYEVLYKEYSGSASEKSKRKRQESTTNIEGNTTLVPSKGNASRIISAIMDGLTSSMSYVGAKNLIEFHKKAKLIQITNAGSIEAHPHLMRSNVN